MITRAQAALLEKAYPKGRQTSCIQPKLIEPRLEGLSQTLETRGQAETVAARGSNGVSGKQSTEVDDS